MILHPFRWHPHHPPSAWQVSCSSSRSQRKLAELAVEKFTRRAEPLHRPRPSSWPAAERVSRGAGGQGARRRRHLWLKINETQYEPDKPDYDARWTPRRRIFGMRLLYGMNRQHTYTFHTCVHFCI